MLGGEVYGDSNQALVQGREEDAEAEASMSPPRVVEKGLHRRWVRGQQRNGLGKTNWDGQRRLKAQLFAFERNVVLKLKGVSSEVMIFEPAPQPTQLILSRT